MKCKLLVSLLALAVVIGTTAFSSPARALESGSITNVEGQNDPVCETPYYISDAMGEYVVNPDNIIDCDVELIQAAHDNASEGDTIKLKGTFNFGTDKPFINRDGNQTWQPGYYRNGKKWIDHEKNLAFWDSPRGTVFITKDIKIIGIENAKIIGGYAPLTVGMAPKQFEYDYYDFNYYVFDDDAFFSVDITVKNLIMNDFALAGIWVKATKGADMEGNRFENPQLVLSRLWSPYATPIIFEGSVLNRDVIDEVPDHIFETQPGDLVYGDIVVKNNYIDGNFRGDSDGVDYFGELSDGCTTGIQVWYTKVNVDIDENTVRGCVRGIATVQQWGMSMIKNNSLEDNVDVGILNHAMTRWTGYAGDYYPGASAKIYNNKIVMREGVLGWAGISSYAMDGVDIYGNELHVEKVEWGAISIEDNAYNHVVKDNKITGSGRSAIHLGWPWYACESNTIKGNDLEDFTPVAHTDMYGVTTIGSHIELVWGAANNTIKDNKYSKVDPNDNEIQNIFFASPIPLYGLPGATGNVVQESDDLKIMDYTDPNGPLYDPETYAGENDIRLDTIR